jgi:hypothetical protein
MSNGNPSIRDQLLIIRGKILQSPINNFLKNLLLEDINLAIDFFDQGNIQGTAGRLRAALTAPGPALNRIQGW